METTVREGNVDSSGARFGECVRDELKYRGGLEFDLLPLAAPPSHSPRLLILKRKTRTYLLPVLEKGKTPRVDKGTRR